MSANCDYIYIEGLRFRTDGVRIYAALDDSSGEGGGDGTSGPERREYRLVKGGPSATDLANGVVSTGTLKEHASWRGKVKAQILGPDGFTVAFLELDPRRCEGRVGRRAFSPERLRERLGKSALSVAREQLRTLPYGKAEVRAARKRLEWALTVIPDGEAGLMALTGSAPFLAGVLAGADLSMLEKRPRDVALLRAVLPVLTATLDLSAEEAREFDLSLAACEESLPVMYRSRVSSFGGSKSDSAFGHVSDPALLRDVVRWMAKDESAAVDERVRHDLALGAIDRLGEVFRIAHEDSQYRRGRSFVQEADMNQKYAALFPGSSPRTVREAVKNAMVTAIGSLSDPELLSRMLQLEQFSGAALEALGEEGIRDILGRIRASDSSGGLIARIAADSPSPDIRTLASAG